MTDTITIIRRTWAMAAAAPDETARVFYSTLFQLAPHSEALFRTDLKAQGEKLMETLGFVVDHLDEQETWLPEARNLAVRHVAYGVVADDYAHVGTALIQTFETLLGDQFGADERQAWVSVYGALSASMIEAAHGT